MRYYGKWMRDEAFKRIGHLYPPVTITKEMLAERPDLKEKGFKAGDQQTVVAWLWARTVKCPNPACGAQMPLVRSFLLSSKGKEKYWIDTKVDRASKPPKIEFVVKKGNKEIPIGTVKRTGARCIACETPVSFEYIRLEGQSDRMIEKLMAIVTNSKKGTLFFSPDFTHEKKAITIEPTWKPDTNLPDKALGFRVQVYGMNTHASLFLKRQLLALTTFCDLYEAVKEKIITDIKNNSRKEEYADAILTYLGIAISQITRYSVTICIWNTTNQNVVQSFSRQAIPMTWDFAESNPLEGKLTLDTTASWVASAIENLGWDGGFGFVQQKNASQALINTIQNPLIVTDPSLF